MEINYNGEWGTVCYDGWSHLNAYVVCRKLGFGSLGLSYGNSYFGQGSGPIWLDNILCTGTESTLASCGHLGLNITRSCSHFEDVGVRCYGTLGMLLFFNIRVIKILKFSPLVVPVRLSNGHNSRSGRVEMYINGQWGTVCNDYWNASSSTVVCRQLGLGNTGTFRSYGAGHKSTPIHLDDVRCNGSEPNILACSHLQLSVHNCDHNKDVGVTCVGLYS